MRLATYEINGQEVWGFVVEDPGAGQLCAVSPRDVEALLPQVCRPTNFFGMNPPAF